MKLHEIHKCGITLQYHFGSKLRNPEEDQSAAMHAICSANARVWFKYDNQWYLTKIESLLAFKHKFDKCYSKEHVLEVITSLKRRVMEQAEWQLLPRATELVCRAITEKEN